jgi:hypothetical protein
MTRRWEVRAATMFVLMIKGIKVYEGEVTPSNMRFKDTKFLQNQMFDLVLIGVTCI